MDDHLRPDELRALRRKARATTLDALQALDGIAQRADIIARALKIGRWTLREMAEPAPPKARYARRVEFELSWALTDLKRAGLLTNPRRGVWAVSGAAADHLAPPPPAPAAPPATTQTSVPPPFVATIVSRPPPAPAAPQRPSLLRRFLAG